MTRMLMVTDVQDIIKRHQAQIITSLKDPDVRLNLLSATSGDQLSTFVVPWVFCPQVNYFKEEFSFCTQITRWEEACACTSVVYVESYFFWVLKSNYILSIRRRALDLLYGMCDVSNAKDIVEELLQVYQTLDVLSFVLYDFVDLFWLYLACWVGFFWYQIIFISVS